MYSVDFKITGVMPLLMHSDDVEASDELDAWRKDAANKNRSKAGDDRSPAWTWTTYLYSDGENIALPSANLMVALRQAGAQKILKKQKTFKEITQSGLLIENEFLQFFCRDKPVKNDWIDALREDDASFIDHKKAVEENGFSLYVKRAKIGTSKHVRVRPRFDHWSAAGRMSVLMPEITFDILTELFQLAGRVGLGDWRPGCKTPGPFGMFEAKIKKV